MNDNARATLQSNEEKLRSAGQVSVVIEGHCDDVGTTEYNLALGERRADAARRYLRMSNTYQVEIPDRPRTDARLS